MNTNNRDEYLLALDTETGGVTDDVSLLTAYYGLFKVNNRVFTLVDELDLHIKPVDQLYRVTAEALSINKINLVTHDAIAKTERQSGTELYNKLKSWYDITGNKLIPVGHNVVFDIQKTKKHLISDGSWSSFVSYRTLDTCTIAQFLRISGKLPENLSCSLVALKEYFDIKVEGEAHEAKYDSHVTINVLYKLMSL